MNLVENFSIYNIIILILSLYLFAPKVILIFKTRKANSTKWFLYLLEVLLMCAITFFMAFPVRGIVYYMDMGVVAGWFILKYIIFPMIYFKYWCLSIRGQVSPSRGTLAGVIIPVLTFITNGLLSRQWILCIFGAIFAMVDYYITIALPKKQSAQLSE